MTDTSSDPIIVTMATEGPYVPLMKNLIASCERFDLPVHSVVYPKATTWAEATHLKMDAIRAALRQHPFRRLLWVDADATIERDPRPHLADPALRTCDLAIHYAREAFHPGTMLVHPTIAADGFLEVWHIVNLCFPDRCDQDNIDRALKNHPIELAQLGPALCYVFDHGEQWYPGVEPAIVHHQASRLYKENPTP